MPEAVKILSEVILRPQLQSEEVGTCVFPFIAVLKHFHIKNLNTNVISKTCIYFQITDARMSVTFDLEDLQLRPEKDVLLTEMIHAVSFLIVSLCCYEMYVLV